MDYEEIGGGSIPACAGEPVGIAGPNCTCRVHPRLRGGATP